MAKNQPQNTFKRVLTTELFLWDLEPPNGQLIPSYLPDLWPLLLNGYMHLPPLMLVSWKAVSRCLKKCDFRNRNSRCPQMLLLNHKSKMLIFLDFLLWCTLSNEFGNIKYSEFLLPLLSFTPYINWFPLWTFSIG